tara:strand:- start:1251 stop:2321 length:1071 start_codon:yes stop_codon:yes gene_type:complete
MAFKKYAYYNKGNKFSIVESEMSGGSGNLAVAHCTLSGYSTKDTCEAAGGQWIPSSSASSSGIWEKYISPKESVADGIEIEYSYAPTFNIQSTGTEGSDFHRFLGWGSDGTNLLLFTFSGASSVVDLSSLFAADDWIYIEGSGRWSGLHQVKSTGSASGVLTLKTRCNLKPSHISVVGTFEADDETFIGDNAAAIVDIETFKDVINSNRVSPYIFIDLAANGNNHGLFSLTTNETSGKITLNKKFSIDSDGDYTETAAACADSGNDTVSIYNVFQENISVYESVEVLEDESFKLDLSDYQAQAVVYYVKAKIAEDLRDVEGREYFMRLFRKQIEKASSSRKRGPYMVQGYSGMRNY